MSRGKKLLIAVGCILLGYGFGGLSWGGTFNLGPLVNTMLFLCSPILIIGGVIYFFKLLKKE